MKIDFLYLKKNFGKILIGVFVIFVVFCFGYLLGIQSKEKEGICPSITQTEPSVSSPKDLGAGEVGEVKVKDEETGEEIPLVNTDTPPVIFGTAGKILEVKSDSLIVLGNGYNFADRTSRELNCIFTESTKTFTENQLKYYKGNEGLKYLKEGMEILIEGEENIRGKTEFKVKTINIISQ